VSDVLLPHKLLCRRAADGVRVRTSPPHAQLETSFTNKTSTRASKELLCTPVDDSSQKTREHMSTASDPRRRAAADAAVPAVVRRRVSTRDGQPRRLRRNPITLLPLERDHLAPWQHGVQARLAARGHAGHAQHAQHARHTLRAQRVQQTRRCSRRNTHQDVKSVSDTLLSVSDTLTTHGGPDSCSRAAARHPRRRSRHGCHRRCSPPPSRRSLAATRLAGVSDTLSTCRRGRRPGSSNQVHAAASRLWSWPCAAHMRPLRGRRPLANSKLLETAQEHAAVPRLRERTHECRTRARRPLLSLTPLTRDPRHSPHRLAAPSRASASG